MVKSAIFLHIFCEMCNYMGEGRVTAVSSAWTDYVPLLVKHFQNAFRFMRYSVGIVFCKFMNGAESPGDAHRSDSGAMGCVHVHT